MREVRIERCSFVSFAIIAYQEIPPSGASRSSFICAATGNMLITSSASLRSAESSAFVGMSEGALQACATVRNDEDR